ncbi:sugar ABC transporter substrate-binding protein [Variovorax robiniae]|uniref:Sugar ABC transporter substrate-binding protein n=1 Tax=Variovorax robiniae TaxID=1836199 RepID=A0ABU8XHM5_9BURK
MITRRTGMKTLGTIAAALAIGLPAAALAQNYPAPQALKAGAQASTSTLKFAGGTPTIAYLPMGTEFNYHIALNEGIKSVPGIKSFMLSPYSGGDQAGQMGMLQDVISRKDVDAILIISFDEHSLAPLIKKAVDAGKAVIIVNSDIPNYPTPVHGVVGVNQRAANKALATWARQQAEGAPRKVGILDGEPSYLATERAGGFTDGIKGSNWNMVARINGGWSVEKGNAAAMDLLQANPGIDVIYASNDYMALGAALAAKSMGRKNLTVLGYDGDTGALENIANGEGVTATTNTSPVKMGRMAAQFAVDLLNKKSTGGYVEVPTQIVQKANAVSVLRNADELFPKPSKKY